MKQHEKFPVLSAPPTGEVYLIVLSYHGDDTCYSLVNKLVWDWYNAPTPKKFDKTHRAIDTNVPAKLVEVLRELEELEEDGTYKVSSGSSFADRLQLSTSLAILEEDATFYAVMELNKFVAANGLTIKGEMSAAGY